MTLHADTTKREPFSIRFTTNIRLRLHLKGKGLNASTCKDLQNFLRLEQDLTDAKIQVAEKFSRYKWEIRVKNPKIFKRALAEYQKNHPDMDIFSDDIHQRELIIQYARYGIAVVSTFCTAMFYIFNYVMPNYM